MFNLKISIFLLVYLIIGNLIMAKPKLSIGSKAPDFELHDQDDNIHKLSHLIGQKIVIYFFPMADTPGWTKQACGFRDKFESYKNANIKIFGISFDSSEKLKKFKRKHNIPFTLLSDRNKKVAKLYNAKGWFFPKRITYIIDEKGIINNIIKDINVHTHGDDILKILKKSSDIIK